MFQDFFYMFQKQLPIVQIRNDFFDMSVFLKL